MIYLSIYLFVCLNLALFFNMSLKGKCSDKDINADVKEDIEKKKSERKCMGNGNYNHKGTLDIVTEIK